MKNGATVAAFEKEFAAYVGARFAIALVNGTATLHTALVALGIKPGDRVAVPPLTMSATTIAVLHAGATPVFVDVDPATWLMKNGGPPADAWMPVSLYGLSSPLVGSKVIDDAAQTLRQHSPAIAFTSYSFQASKILSTGEGGMLVTNDEALATRAREFSSLGYRMRADQPRIETAVLKSPTFDRHHSLGWNYRMNDVTASEGLRLLTKFERRPTPGTIYIADDLRDNRLECATLYADVIDNAGCDWLTPQHVPEGWRHDYWTYAVACDTPERARLLAAHMAVHGGETPYPAWKLTYDEPAFRHLVYKGRFYDRDEYDNPCPVAESLQPRILQMQTNNLASAERNATALRRAIDDVGVIQRFGSLLTGIPCG